MQQYSAKSTIVEPAREVLVRKEADVVVVGGGPAGVAAAVAAARNGVETILVERYGHLGGMATGGLVTLIMPMSDGTNDQQIAGICQEIVDRLDSVGAALHPAKEDLGSKDRKLITHWQQYPFFVVEGRVRLSVLVDPEMLKCVLNDIIEDSGITLLLHSWGSRAIVDGETVQGIIFESKSGRQAILAKVVIDATGDGDIFASAGAEFDGKLDPALRSSKLALVFQVANVNCKRLDKFKESRPQLYSEQMHELEGLGGFIMHLRSGKEDVVWFNNFLPGLSAINAEDLTWVEVNARKKMRITYDFFRKHIPGFEKSFIMNTASQVGTRSSRRLIGEYIVTENDIRSGTLYCDTIAVCPPFHHNVSEANPHMHIPYRSLVPRKVENLLAAGRCLSSDLFSNDLLSPIQFCIAMGQAAGTAAALSIKDNVPPRKVDYAVLKDRLIDQGVPLPKA